MSTQNTRGISPSTYRVQRKAEGGFRCDECTGRYPLSFMREQDGRTICKTTCLRSMGKEDIAEAQADAAQRAQGQDQYLERPITSTFAGEALIRSVEDVANLPTAGGTADFDISGQNLGSVTYTATTPLTVARISIDADEENAVLRVTVPALTTRGDYHFFASIKEYAIRKGHFKVR